MPVWRATIDGQTGPIRIPYDDNGVTRYAIGNDANNPDVYKCCCAGTPDLTICEEITTVTLELRNIEPVPFCSLFRCRIPGAKGRPPDYSRDVQQLDINGTWVLPITLDTGVEGACAYEPDFDGMLGPATGQPVYEIRFYDNGNCSGIPIGRAGLDPSQNDVTIRVWLRKAFVPGQGYVGDPGVYEVLVSGFMPAAPYDFMDCSTVTENPAFIWRPSGRNYGAKGGILPNEKNDGGRQLVGDIGQNGEAIVTW